MNTKCPDGLTVLMSNLARIHANLRFADAKAGAVLVINTSLMGVMYSLLDKASCSTAESMDFYVPSLLAISSLLIGAGFSVSVLWPRADRFVKRGRGLLDPVRIAQYKCDEFLEEISAAESKLIYKHAQELTWDVSKIDRAKYRMLDIALKVSVVAWMFTVSLIAVIIMKATA